jgi:O-antigen/teichoic acid export membrane protein
MTATIEAPLPAGGDTHAPPRIIRTGMALLSAQSVSWIASLGSVLIVPRYLGADSYGLYATAMTATLLAGLGASFGASRVVLRETAREPGAAANIAAHTAAVRLLIWCAVALVGLPAAWLLIDRPHALVVVTLMGGAAALSTFGDIALAALQAQHALGRAALMRSGILVAAQTVTCILVVAGFGVGSVAALALLSAAVTTATTIWLFWRRFAAPLRWSASRALQLGAAGAPLLAVDIAVTVYTGAGTLVLAATAGTVEVGPYALAWRLVGVPTFVLGIVAGATFPSLAAAHHDPARFRPLLANALRVLIAATVPMAAGLVLLAPDVVRLVGGDEYADAVPVTRIVGSVLPVMAMNTVLGMAALAIDRQRAWAAVTASLAAANLGLTYIAVRAAAAAWGSGATGAAIVPATLELIMTTSALMLLGRYCPRAALARVVARTLVATAPMALVTLLAHRTAGIVAAVPAGAATYAVAAVALHLVSRSDASLLVAALRRRGGAAAGASVSA